MSNKHNHAIMKSMHRRRRGSDGMISMITVVLLSVILTIITTGFLRIIARNQREATEKQLAQQAIYAAEAGIEDAKKAIANPVGISKGSNTLEQVLSGAQDTCAVASGGALGTIGSDLGNNSSYTCQLIDPTPNELEYNITENDNQLARIRMATGSSYERIKVTWSAYQNQGTKNLLPAGGGWDLKQLPTASTWQTANYLAMLRLEFMTVKPASNSGALPADVADQGLTRDQFYRNERTYFFAPKPIGSSDVNLTLCNETGTARTLSSECSLDTQFNDAVKGASCNNGTCNVVLQLRQPSGSQTVGGTVARQIDSSYMSILRIRPIYADAYVKVEVLDAANNPQQIVGGQTVIDVTGKAGTVAKRVRVRIPPENVVFPDFAINTAENLCKLYEVGASGPNTVSQSCDD